MPNGNHPSPGEIADAKARDAQRSIDQLKNKVKELRDRVERLEDEIKDLKQNKNDPRA